MRVTYYYYYYYYYDHDERMPLYFLTLFAKGDRANLSKAERNDLAILTEALVGI